MKHSRTVLAMVALFALSGADWPQFRGPGAAGIGGDKAVPVEWSSQDNIVWKTELPGPGTSSPITVGNRIYVTCYSGYGLTPNDGDMKKLMRHLVCLDRDGKILWTRDFEPLLPESEYRRGNDSEHGYASSTPASDGMRLYVFFGKSGVYCLDLDGKEIWHESVGTRATGWGSANSPVLFGDLVIINASIESGNLVALDKRTGKEVWQVPKISSSWNTPVLVEPADGGVELVVNESKAVIAFDPANGKELWRVPGFGGYVCPSVVAHKGIVYVVRNNALAIRSGGRGDVSETHVLWRGNGNSLVSSPIYHDGRLYWPGGGAFCLDAATGKEVYRGKFSDRAGFYASPIVVDDKLYYVSRFNGTYVVSAGAQFKELAHNTFADDPSRTNASPIVSDGRLLLRTDRFLYCIGKK